MAETERTDRGNVPLVVIVAVLLGAAGGIGLYTFHYAEGGSYLTSNPQACANCHVMQGHLDAWVKSSHSKFATCNDCHAPHTNVVAKYAAKGRNGLFHSVAFTTGDYEDNLRITEFNREVTEAACRYCHLDMIHTVDLQVAPAEPIACIRCHSTVGHDK